MNNKNKSEIKHIPDPETEREDYWSLSAKAAWYRVCDSLYQRGHLREAVLHLVEIYCDNITLYDILTSDLLENKEFKKADRDSERKSVTFQERTTVSNQIRDLEKRLGISPYAFARVKDLEVEQSDDPMDIL